MQATAIDRVRDLLGTLAKAQKDYKTYPRNNPILINRREELATKLAALFSQMPELPLSVEPETLRFGSASVYMEKERRESIAFHLHRHGIREIRFVGGITIEEMDAFIDAINTDFDNEASDDDLATVLWTRDLPHVRWEAVDDVPEGATWQADPLGALRGHLDKELATPRFADAMREHGGSPARDPRADLAAINLSGEELVQLRSMIEDDRRKDLALQVIDVLTSVLRETTDPNEARNLLRILERVVEISVEQRNFNRAATTLTVLGELVKSQPSLASAVRGTIAKFGEPREVKALIEIVSKTDPSQQIDELDLHRYLIQLTKSAVVPLAEAMGVLQDRRLRKVFCEALAELVKAEPNLLAGLSRDTRWFVTRNVAYILGLTKNPESLKILRSLAVHTNEKVRAEAVRAAGMMGANARDIVQRAVSDADRLVRLLALDLIPVFADAATPQVLVTQIESREFEEKESAEKRALCLALARIAGEHALAPLSRILVRSAGLLGSKDESRIAAAAGIAAIGTQMSTGYLRQGAASTDTALSAICVQALREAKLT